MERSTTGLGSYISAIHYGDSASALFEERIFDYGITHRPPQLVSDRCNRILLYPGSFNPPHLGHQELLRHAFSRSGSDLNIIAAIVLPLDDTALAWKFKGQTGVQIFTKAQRVRLWKDNVPSEWYWVYDRSIDEWFTFKDSLTKAILREGFDIEFVLLCGPDYVKMNRVPLVTPWGCKGLLVSDIGRAADFTNGTMDYLTTLNDCEPWETIVSNHENLRKRAREDSNWVWSGLLMLNPKFGQSKLDTGELRFSYFFLAGLNNLFISRPRMRGSPGQRQPS